MFFAGAGFWLSATASRAHADRARVACRWWSPPRSRFFWSTAGDHVIVLWFAYVPRGVIRGFNRFGDYSYGIYISPSRAAYLWRGDRITGRDDPVRDAGTLPLAMASWHFVEKTLLARRSASGNHSGAGSGA